MTGRSPAIASSDPEARGPAALLARPLALLNRLALAASMLALLAACAVLTTSVFLRYFLKVPTDWQDEVAVFLLVGATFFSAGHVQARRGHIGIEIAAGLLSPAANRVRRALCDFTSLLFCAFFTWKSYALWYEAFSEGQTTESAWAPPLALPYGLMCVGMTLLTLQLALQCLQAVQARAAAPAAVAPARGAP